MKRYAKERDHRDPVCDMMVSRLSAVADSQYQGKTYYFCAPECRAAFVADPRRYLRDHRQRGMPERAPAPEA